HVEAEGARARRARGRASGRAPDFHGSAARVSLLDIILQALSNLRRQKLRTSLTVTGVALGVATITIMVSFGAGIRKMVAEKFDRAELPTLIQATPIKMAIRSIDDLRKLSVHPPKPVPITDETLDQLKKELPQAVAIYPDVSAPLTAEASGRVESVSSEGLPVEALGDTHKKALIAGEYWKGEDAEDVAVIPSTILDALGF